MKLTSAQEQWLRALESGEYEQTAGWLRAGDAFCCLGVACDLYDSTAWSAISDYYYYGHENVFDKVLPREVQDWLGLRDGSGSFYGMSDSDDNTWTLKKTGVNNATLACLNDEGVSFREMAAIIRRNPEAFFKGEIK